jgi:hypothetical protein
MPVLLILASWQNGGGVSFNPVCLFGRKSSLQNMGIILFIMWIGVIGEFPSHLLVGGKIFVRWIELLPLQIGLWIPLLERLVMELLPFFGLLIGLMVPPLRPNSPGFILFRIIKRVKLRSSLFEKVMGIDGVSLGVELCFNGNLISLIGWLKFWNR